MKLPFLASFIIFILVLARRIKRQDRLSEKENRSFWEREARANATRRKPLDDLEYITIPWDALPTEVMQDDATVAECQRLLRELSEQRIVNFTGFTNTDLKLEYGAPNITLLTEYDQNYTVLVRTLQQWADVLWDGGYEAEASIIMEFAISTHTDVSRTYYKLAQYWASHGESMQIERLLATAETLRSANKASIIRTLKDNYQ
ncbi:MAG: hypothetical protein IJ833_00705 [Lachnospiraceae bacterium]|nr:hypothetical protein [Lachnospiraceae bacterium]